MITSTPNVGFLDRMVRGLLAIDLLAVCFIALISGPAIVLFCTVAGFFLFTAITGVCPIYTLLGRNTRQRTEP